MIKPIGDRVLIKPDAEKTVTSVGIVIPDTETEKPLTGVIVEISDEVGDKFKVGDRVYYPRYTGAQVFIQDTAHLIIKTEDIMGKEI